MRWRIVKTIWLKELLETMRDRRTMIIMVFLPVILYPVLLIGFGQIITHQQAKQATQKGQVMIVGDYPKELAEKISEDETLQIIKAPESFKSPKSFEVKEIDDPGKDWQKRFGELIYDPSIKSQAAEIINNGDADLVLVLPGDFSDRLYSDRSARAVYFYDRANDKSRNLHDRFESLMLELRLDFREARMKAHPELPKGFQYPIYMDSSNIAPAKKLGGYFAGQIIPMLLIIMVMLGAFYPAVDLTAGEKERGTMQTLLTAPAMAMEIIFGKFLTVFCVSMLSALANLGSMALAIIILLESNNLGDSLQFHLSLKTGLIILLQLIPVAFLFSALMLAVSVFAKSFKEAQNYLTPLYLVVIIPVIVSGLPGTNLTNSSAWIPVLNITLLMKNMLVGEVAVSLIIIVLIANSAYSILALVAAVKIFKSEEVLLGGQSSFADIFRIKGEGKVKATPGLAFTLFSAGLVIYHFYVGMVIAPSQAEIQANPFELIKVNVASQYLMLLLPALLIVFLFKMDYKEVFSVKAPSLTMTIAVILMGLSSWIVLGALAGWLQNLILPEPKEISERMKQSLGLINDDFPLYLMLFAFAFTPALCEEAFFRGPILSGLRNGMKKWPAILLTALLFGIFHVSIYRIMPTAFIGILVTLIVWESRSIFAGILFHLMHNGITLIVHKKGLFKEMVQDGEFNLLQFSGFVLIFIAGLSLLIFASKKSKAGSITAGSEPS